MKKLFDKVGKKRENNSLVGKVVLVGQYSVKVEALIGEGGFATIYKCVDMKSGHTFALKHMRLGADADAIKEVQQEAKTMARLKGHPNILKLHAVAFAGPAGAETDGFMLLDYCPQTLLDVMQRSNFNLDDYLVYEVFQDVVFAVSHMHKCSPSLAHRDLKAENVLKNGEGRWVICDFGSSTARAQVYDTPTEIAMEEENIRRTTTPAYRAPEMWDLYSRQRIDTAVDVWALGVLLYVLSFGKLPFQGDSKLSILYGKYEMPPGRPPAMRSLIQDMLQVNPKDRPDIFQVISRLDILRSALSGDHVDTLQLTGLAPGPPPPQLQPQLPSGPHPPHAQTQPQGNSHSHAQSQSPQLQQFVPGPPLSCPPAGAHGPYPGQLPPPQQHPGGAAGPLQQPNTQPSQLTNGQPSSWAQAPSPVYISSVHIPAHMHPQLQPHAHAQPQPHTHSQTPPPPQPHHQPHPSPYASPQHGQNQHQQYPPHSQPGQPQLYGHNSPAAPHTGPGPGPGTAVPLAGAQPRSGAGAPPAQRVPSRQGSFSPNWPQPSSALPQQQQQPGQQLQPASAITAGSASSSAPQFMNLMDAGIQEPMPTAVSAAVSDWEQDFQSAGGGGSGGGVAGAAALTSSRPQETMAVSAAATAGAAVSSPVSVTYNRCIHVHHHRRTGSNSEPIRLQMPSPAATAGATTAHAAVGFGDDNVDWGEQPAFSCAGNQQQPPQSDSQLFQLGSLTLVNSNSNGGGGGDGGGGGSVLAASPARPLAPQSAGIYHGSIPNSNSGQCTPLAATPAGAIAALQSGPERAASSAAVSATAAVTAPYGPVSSGAVARQLGATPDASGAVVGGTSSPLMQRAGSFELVAGGAMEAESLRAQLQHVTASNTHLEGRVRQLEGTVASQGAFIHRLASELRTLRQQQQPQQAALPPSPQPHHIATVAQPPAGALSSSGSSGGGGCGGRTSSWLQRLAPSGSGAAAPAKADDTTRVVGGGGGLVDGGGGGKNTGGADFIVGSHFAVVPASPARAAALRTFDPEPWSSPGAAIYPPIRYEDLA